MDVLDIIGWIAYGLMFAGLIRLGRDPDRAPRGLDRLDLRR